MYMTLVESRLDIIRLKCLLVESRKRYCLLYIFRGIFLCRLFGALLDFGRREVLIVVAL